MHIIIRSHNCIIVQVAERLCACALPMIVIYYELSQLQAHAEIGNLTMVWITNDMPRFQL